MILNPDRPNPPRKDTAPASPAPVEDTAKKLGMLFLTLPVTKIALAAVVAAHLGIAAWGWPFFAALAFGWWMARYGRALTNIEAANVARAETAKVEAQIEREKAEFRAAIAQVKRPEISHPLFSRN